MQSRSPEETLVIMSELVLPNDTNTMGNLMGGRLMHWMDIAGAISSQKHCSGPVVTASVDNVSFASPIKLGSVLTIEAKITRSFNTSMEVYLRVFGEEMSTRHKYLSNEAYMTFVALDTEGRPRKVPELIPETETDKKMYDGALQRRQLRLILSGKMKMEDAGALHDLFINSK
jgi:acyl-CoA hydrolase